MDLADQPLRGAEVREIHVSIPSDDAPEDEAARLHILAHDDYYVAVSGPSRSWPMGRAVRLCTSGARNGVVTLIFAGLYFAIRGERQRAVEALRSAILALCREQRDCLTSEGQSIAAGVATEGGTAPSPDGLVVTASCGGPGGGAVPPAPASLPR